MQSSETGIVFSNNTKQTFEFNFIDFGYFINGAGVAVLDYDQDGLTDIYFVSNQEDNRLFRNLGDWKFEDVSQAAGLLGFDGFHTGVNVVDVNSDGYDDLYVARSNADERPEGAFLRSNLLFVNQGDGTFKEQSTQYGLASDRPTTQSVFFDYDLDGDLDCYLVNTPMDYLSSHKIRVQNQDGQLKRVRGPKEAYESDQLFRNEGNGFFADVSKQAGIDNRAWGLSAAVNDFNEDGFPDIYIANDYVEPDMLYINQGDGTFADEIQNIIRHTSHNSMGSDLADINNDGLLDLFVVDMLSDSNYRRKALETLMMPDRYNTLVRHGYGHQVMWNVMQLNNGNGSFSEVGSMAGVASTDWSWSPLFADFDHDGQIDLHITNGYRYDITNTDYLRYTTDSINRLGGLTREMFADFNDYLAMIPTQRVPNFIFQNQGDLQFQDQTINWGMNQPSYSSGSAYADFDNDGDLDLVVNNMDENAFVYRNRLEEHPDVDNRHYLRVRLEGPNGYRSGQGATVTARNEGYLNRQRIDHARGFQSASDPVAHFGLGKQRELAQLTVDWPDGRSQTLNNVKADQTLTLRYKDANSSHQIADVRAPDAPTFSFPRNQRGLHFKHRENDFDDFNREFLLPRKLSREGPAAAQGDINGDGLSDLFFGGARGSDGALFVQKADGNFQEISATFLSQHRSNEDVDAVFFDADQDGDQDLFVVSGGNEDPAGNSAYQDRLYFNDGKGGFTAAPAENLPALTNSGARVLVMDIDHNGTLDLLVAARGLPGRYPEPDRSVVLTNDGQGRFKDETERWLPDFAELGMLSDLAAADLDGDGLAEIVVVGDWLPVTIFQRTTKDAAFTLSPRAPEKSEGWWNTLEIADVNDDGRPDLVLGNEGLNSRLRPAPSRPLLLFAADFDDNGSTDPIHAFYEGDKRYPVTNREAMVRQLPHLKKKYLRTTPFANATIEEILGAEAMKIAKRYEVNELHSLVYYNLPDGWQRSPLPAVAQQSPVRDLLVRDFNADGHPDLLLVGNDWGTEVETGRYDAGNGVLLLNAGTGKWEVVENRQSGFWASMDARGLLSLTLADGKSAVLITNNNFNTGLYTVQ